MIKIAISCYMSQTFWTANEFRPETKTRTLPTIDAKPESENRQSVCRRSAKKQIHPTVKKLTAWRKLDRLSQRKAVAVLAYFHATFPSLRSWEEGRRSPNSHTAAILEKFPLDHPSVERPKK
jgi:DNA-binding transcriptional regulator YiaG